MERSFYPLTSKLMSSFLKNYGAGCVAVELENDPIPFDSDPGQITAKVSAGEVVEVTAPASPPELFLHLDVDAPGEGPTGIPSVAKGEAATLTATMRETAVESSAIVDYSGTVRAPYYQNGVYHSELRMEFEAGVCAYIFKPESHQHGRLTVNEDEIGELNGYKIRVVGDKELIVDQKSAA